MAYGFNLGQIEGLDSSVQTVTLTIANATESNTYTLNYHLNEDDMDSWFDDDETFLLVITPIGSLLGVPEFTESDVGDTYNVTLSTSAVEENFKSAVETVLADNGLISVTETLFDGTITITAEDVQGVEIPFDKDVSSYPFEKWTVTVNGLEIPYQAAHNAFILESDNIGYSVFGNDGIYGLEVISMTGADYPPVPGDYQVKIVYTSESGEATDIKIVRFYYDGDEPMCDTRIDDIFTDDGIPNIRNNIVFMFQNCVGMEVSPADNKSQIRVGFLIEPVTYIRFTLNRNNTVTQQEFTTNITLTPVT